MRKTIIAPENFLISYIICLATSFFSKLIFWLTVQFCYSWRQHLLGVSFRALFAHHGNRIDPHTFLQLFKYNYLRNQVFKYKPHVLGLFLSRVFY